MQSEHGPAGYPMNLADSRYPAGDLRISDADRDAALAELSEHFHGRLTSDELDERIGRAIRARTGQDLADLMADLPAARRPGGGSGIRPGAGAAPASRRTPATAVIIIVVVVAAALTAAIAAGLGHGHAHVTLVPGWVVLVAFIAWRRLAASRSEPRGRP